MRLSSLLLAAPLLSAVQVSHPSCSRIGGNEELVETRVMSAASSVQQSLGWGAIASAAGDEAWISMSLSPRCPHVALLLSEPPVELCPLGLIDDELTPRRCTSTSSRPRSDVSSRNFHQTPLLRVSCSGARAARTVDPSIFPTLH